MANPLRDPGAVEFTATLQGADAGGCFVDFPGDLKAMYGKGNLVPVRALWDGKVEYRGSLAKMGGDCAMLLCRKDVQAQLGKGPGDSVHVRVELDAGPRPLDLPQALETALQADAAAQAGWAALAPSCRREYAQWIGDAKRDDTRARRVAEAIPLIAAGQRLR